MRLIRTAMIALFHRRAVSHFMSSLVYVSGKGPDVEVGDGLPLLGRGIAHDGALSEVQLSEHRMNLRIAEFCSGGESRKRRSGAGRRFGLRKFAVFADRGPHDKGVPPLHRGLLFRSRGKYSVSACRGGADVRSRPFQSVRRAFFHLSRPEKGLQKRVNLMQQTTNSDLSRHYLPRQLRHLILQEYLSGVKTARQLSEEHGIPMSTIHKMGQRWKAKNSCSFVSTPNPYPIMSRVTSEEASELLSENKALRRRLEEALLRLEGYEIMGDILQEEYGIDLLKKSAAGQSSVSKKDTQQ